MYYLILIMVAFTSFLIIDVYGEENILISISTDLDEVIFDGKWTNINEWKKSSYNRLTFNDGTEIHLRTGHQEDFIYVHLNIASDTEIDKGVDNATICFDTKNDKTIRPQDDDYCFFTSLDRKVAFTYQGSSIPAINGFFKKIPNHENFIAIGTASDKVDRYSKTPHTTYEFKIPLDVIGRSDNYGFYISVFDGHSQNHYSWPHNIHKQSLTSISSPNQWGNLISPDKSLPEFNFSLVLFLIIPIITSILIPKFYQNKLSIVNY